MDYKLHSSCAMDRTVSDAYLNPDFGVASPNSPAQSPVSASSPPAAISPASAVSPASPESPVYVEPSSVTYNDDPIPLGRLKIGQRCLETIAKRVKENFYAYISSKNEKKCYFSSISNAVPGIRYIDQQLVVTKKSCKKGNCVDKNFCLTTNPDRGNKHLQAVSRGQHKEKDVDLLRWTLCCSKEDVVDDPERCPDRTHQQWLFEEESGFMRPITDTTACLTFYNERNQRGYAKVTNVPEKCLPIGSYYELEDRSVDDLDYDLHA